MSFTKTCSKCGTTKDLSDFSPRRGTAYLSSHCKPCQRTKKRYTTSPEAKTRAKKKQLEKHRFERHHGIEPAKYILMDCKNSDRRKNLTCDLDIAYVENAIKNGCFYCEDTSSKMTLDRVDNDIGHTKGNVIPSCYRCNILRRDMPIEAWMALTPVIKKAREDGLFGDWLQKVISSR